MPRDNLLLRWCLAVGVAAAVVWFAAPAPRSAARNADSTPVEGWVVPRLPRHYDPAATAGTLARSELWGRQSEAAPAVDDSAKPWRIAGLAGQGRDRVVLVHIGDDRLVPLKVGDKFPDGTPIAEIRDHGVCVELGGKKRLLPLNNQFVPIVW